MKQRLGIFLILVICLSVFNPVTMMAQEEVKVRIDGELVSFDTLPFIESGRLFVPIRSVFEPLHAQFHWNRDNQTACIENHELMIELTIGSKIASVYRKQDLIRTSGEITLDVAPIIIDGTTFVPIRFVAEALGADVQWEPETSTASIYTRTRVVFYETITSADITDNPELITWYEQNYRNNGVHYHHQGSLVYVLLSAGEQRTGGYDVTIDSIYLDDDTLMVSAHLLQPSPDTMVTEALTYPNLLITVQRDHIHRVQGQVKPSSHFIKPSSGGDDITVINSLEELGETLNPENIQSIQLFSLEQSKLNTYNQEEVRNLTKAYNESVIDDSLYIMLITGNTMVITFKDGSEIRLTSYGSTTNIVATGQIGQQSIGYHLVCPPIASILLENH